MGKILVVDDMIQWRDLVRHAMGHGYDVVGASSFLEADEKLSRLEFNLILLDIFMPDGSSFDFCLKLRSQERTKAVPIVFFSSSTNESDEITCFAVGADDYVAKPMDVNAFKARLEARMRRSTLQEINLVASGIELNCLTQKVYLGDEKTEIPLSSLEFKLLALFMRRKDQVLSREQIIEALWGNTHITDRSVDNHVYTLRKKLGAFGSAIEAVYGVGYRFLK